MFKLPVYTAPDFTKEPFVSAPDVTTEKAGDGFCTAPNCTDSFTQQKRRCVFG